MMKLFLFISLSATILFCFACERKLNLSLPVGQETLSDTATDDTETTSDSTTAVTDTSTSTSGVEKGSDSSPNAHIDTGTDTIIDTTGN